MDVSVVDHYCFLQEYQTYAAGHAPRWEAGFIVGVDVESGPIAGAVAGCVAGRAFLGELEVRCR